MKHTFFINALATAVAALPQTTSTPPPSFNITNVVVGGTGCPQGSIDVRWTDSAILPICKTIDYFLRNHVWSCCNRDSGDTTPTLLSLQGCYVLRIALMLTT